MWALDDTIEVTTIYHFLSLGEVEILYSATTKLHVDVITLERNIKKALRLCIRLHTFLSKFGTFFLWNLRGGVASPWIRQGGARWSPPPPLNPPLAWSKGTMPLHIFIFDRAECNYIFNRGLIWISFASESSARKDVPNQLPGRNTLNEVYAVHDNIV